MEGMFRQSTTASEGIEIVRIYVLTVIQVADNCQSGSMFKCRNDDKPKPGFVTGGGNFVSRPTYSSAQPIFSAIICIWTESRPKGFT